MALTLGGPAPVAELANPAAGTVYRVQGGAPLRGEVVIRGAKNSALPIVAATLLTEDACVIENVPNASDIRVMLEVLEHLGARVHLDAERYRLEVEAKDIRSRTTPEELATRLRGSFSRDDTRRGRFRMQRSGDAKSVGTKRTQSERLRDIFDAEAAEALGVSDAAEPAEPAEPDGATTDAADGPTDAAVPPDGE